ncbi:hypothetical protein WG66_001549 [Moniliophthora roreri]|nr:hypothetical protein WG66_001549 [Moniliophthora roreri]
MQFFAFLAALILTTTAVAAPTGLGSFPSLGLGTNVSMDPLPQLATPVSLSLPVEPFAMMSKSCLLLDYSLHPLTGCAYQKAGWSSSWVPRDAAVPLQAISE